MLYTALVAVESQGCRDPTSVPAAQRFRALHTAGLASAPESVKRRNPLLFATIVSSGGSAASDRSSAALWRFRRRSSAVASACWPGQRPRVATLGMR